MGEGGLVETQGKKEQRGERDRSDPEGRGKKINAEGQKEKVEGRERRRALKKKKTEKNRYRRS